MYSTFRQRKHMLKDIRGAHSEAYQDSIRICELEGKPGLLNLLRLSFLFVKHRHHLFYTEGRGFVNFARALLYPIMQIYDYRYLVPTKE